MNIETEKKYIIEKPNIKELERQNGLTESEITQIYLNSQIATHRVRKRSFSDGRVEFTENKKVRISRMSSEEYESEISESDFLELAKNIENGVRPLHKTRKTFLYGNKTIELDYYPEWENTCVMEIELESENESIEIPDFIKIIADVTGEREYSNHAMAHNFPKEII